MKFEEWYFKTIGIELGKAKSMGATDLELTEQAFSAGRAAGIAWAEVATAKACAELALSWGCRNMAAAILKKFRIEK